MIAAAAGRWHFAFGTALELAIGENCEAHAAIYERSGVLSDALLAGRRVPGVGMVRRLRLMDDVHPRPGHVVAAGFLRGLLRRAALAPVVALIHVMIVGDRNARPVARQLAPRPAVQI